MQELTSGRKKEHKPLDVNNFVLILMPSQQIQDHPTPCLWELGPDEPHGNTEHVYEAKLCLLNDEAM
jgi:hypothetical protein